MQRWLTQSSKMRGRQQPPSPKPFELRCACGNDVHGVRRAEHHEVLCRQCGEQLFVLPLDVYPPLKTKKSRRKKGGKRGSDAQGAGENRPRMRERVKTGTRHLGRLARHVGGRVRGTGAKATGILLKTAKRQSEFFTPFRLVMISTLVVVVGTIYWVMQQGDLESAARRLQSAKEAGYTAMRAGDFSAAADELEEACRALDQLGDGNPQAGEIRQMFREASAASQLSSMPLYDIVTAAERIAPDDRAGWEERFNALYADQWIVMQTAIDRVTNAAGDSRLIIDYPLVAGRPVDIEAAFPIFNRLVKAGAIHDVIFAAQLQSCRLVGKEDERWQIQLNPETAFLWTDFENLRALGFATGEADTEKAVQQLLAEQSQLVGVER